MTPGSLFSRSALELVADRLAIPGRRRHARLTQVGLLDLPGVAAVEPEVPPGLDRLLRHAEVALVERERLARPDDDLADVPLRHLSIRLGVDDSNLEPLVEHVARAAGLDRVAGLAVGDD